METRYEDIWLIQKMMALLYDMNIKMINYLLTIFIKIMN